MTNKGSSAKQHTGAPRPAFRRSAPTYQAKGGQTRLTLNVPLGIAHVIHEACERDEIGPSEFIRRLVTWYAWDTGACEQFFADRARAHAAVNTKRIAEHRRRAESDPQYPLRDITITGEVHEETPDEAARDLLETLEFMYGAGTTIAGWSFPANEVQTLRQYLIAERDQNARLARITPDTPKEEVEALAREIEDSKRWANTTFGLEGDDAAT